MKSKITIKLPKGELSSRSIIKINDKSYQVRRISFGNKCIIYDTELVTQ